MAATAFEIEKGIPVGSKVGVSHNRKYPWFEMDVGDSVLIPGGVLAKITGSYNYCAMRTGAKFLGRTVDGGVRVWRIA